MEATMVDKEKDGSVMGRWLKEYVLVLCAEITATEYYICAWQSTLKNSIVCQM